MAAVEVVPASSVMLTPSSGSAALFGMLPVTFHVKPAAVAVRKDSSHRKVTLTRRKPLLQIPVRSRIATAMPPAYMLRTAADVTNDGVFQSAGFDDDSPVRFVTAEFSAPYVAVPTANGWLLIQL